MANLSKTARASIQAGEGTLKQTAVAWGFKPNHGRRIQLRPFITFFDRADAQWWAEHNLVGGYVVYSDELNRNTRR